MTGTQVTTMDSTRRGLISRLTKGAAVSGVGILGTTGSASASLFGGSVDILDITFRDNSARPEEGETLTIGISVENSYNEPKDVFFILDLRHENSLDRYYHVNLDQDGALWGAVRRVGGNQIGSYEFEWSPPIDMEPGVYRRRLTINDENDLGWTNYDRRGWVDAVAVGYDVDIACKNAVENHAEAVAGAGGRRAVGGRGHWVSTIPSFAAIVYSSNQMAEEC